MVRIVLLMSTGLLALNAWWLWRNMQLITDLRTIEFWMAAEQFTRAEPDLREHVRSSPHNGEARIMLARLLAAQGNLLGCAKELHAVPYWWPTKAEALYREGQAYLMINRARDAEICWLAVIEDDPLHPKAAGPVHDASLELLKLYSTEERWEEVHEVLWRAYENAGTDDRLTLLSMRVRSELERLAPEVSIKQLEQYVAADRSDSEALRALARAELALSRRDAARRHFQVCLEVRPDDPRVWREYLTMLYDLGDLDAWAGLLAKAPQSVESDSEIWRFRGLLKEKSGDWIGAAANYQKALDRNPYVLATHYRLGMVEERLGHHEIAAEHRKRTDQLREARAELRLAYTDLNNAEDARVKQIVCNPDLPTSMRRLASVCETLGWARLAEAWRRLADDS
jgi:tetratricopeptide (TPR) repeat protein